MNLHASIDASNGKDTKNVASIYLIFLNVVPKFLNAEHRPFSSVYVYVGLQQNSTNSYFNQ